MLDATNEILRLASLAQNDRMGTGSLRMTGGGTARNDRWTILGAKRSNNLSLHNT